MMDPLARGVPTSRGRVVWCGCCLLITLLLLSPSAHAQGCAPVYEDQCVIKSQCRTLMVTPFFHCNCDSGLSGDGRTDGTGCQAETCPLPTITNAVFDVPHLPTDTFPVQDIIRYQCRAGYRFPSTVTTSTRRLQCAGGSVWVSVVGASGPGIVHCLQDIDECATGTHNCSASTECLNTVGAFECNCGIGNQRVNSTHCQAISSSFRCPMLSTPQGKWNHTGEADTGGYLVNSIARLQCNAGYASTPPNIVVTCSEGDSTWLTRGSERLCENVNECIQDSTLCAGKPGSVCIDEPGSYSCPCTGSLKEVNNRCQAGPATTSAAAAATTTTPLVRGGGNTDASKDSSPLSVPIIVAIACGTVVVILLVILALFVIHRLSRVGKREAPASCTLERQSEPSFHNLNYAMAPIIPIKTPGDPAQSMEGLSQYQNFVASSNGTIEGFLIPPSHGNSMASIGLCSLDGQLHSTGPGGAMIFTPMKQMPGVRSQSTTDVSAYSTKWLVSPQLSTEPGLTSPPPNTAAPALPRSAAPAQTSHMPFPATESSSSQEKVRLYHNSSVENFKPHQALHTTASSAPLLAMTTEAEEKTAIERRPSGSSRKFVRSSPDGHPSQHSVREHEMRERAPSAEPTKGQPARQYEIPVDSRHNLMHTSPSKQSFTESDT